MIAKKGNKDEIPAFLNKTFHMINSCDPNIATWSRDGLTFIVKDPDTFASDIVPQFFKHNNFSSFVRQLNFYGFRKIKFDSVRLNYGAESSKWWRFKHENFIRGRPDLLRDIKKANQVNAADQAEVDKLKEEVSVLRDEMRKMSALVQQMSGVLRQVTGSGFSTHEPVNKRRKLEADSVGSFPIKPLPIGQGSMPSLSLTDCVDPVHHEVSLLDPTVSDADLLLDDFPVEYQPVNPPDYQPVNHMEYHTGTVSPPIEKVPRSTSADIVESMFDFVKDDEVINGDDRLVPDVVDSTTVYNRSVSSYDDTSQTTQISPDLSAKLKDAVSALPKPLQESFVERIVESVFGPDAYQKHVEAVSVLATAAAIEAQNKTALQGDGQAYPDKLSVNNPSEMTLPIAAAALGAFLAKYGNALANSSSNPSR